MIGTTYGNGLQDLPYIILTEKQFTVPPSFRGDLFFLFQPISKIGHDTLVVLSNRDEIL
jgi:hypothetical protein